MNITKRIISTFLAIVMVLGAFSALFTVQVFAAEDTSSETESDTTLIGDYVTKVYNSPEEKLATMELMRTVGKYQLWVDRLSGEVAWVEVETDAQGNLVKDAQGNTIPTENILFTNPYDVAASKGSKTTKQELLSQIIVAFSDPTGTSKQLYSYTDAALNDQITVDLIKGGVRVEYIIGREDGRKLIPKLILDESFQTNIMDNIRKAAEPGGPLEKEESGKAVKWFLNAWLEFNPNTMPPLMAREYINKYPVLGETYVDENGKEVYPVLWSWSDKMSNANDTLRRELWIKTYCPDYTFEQLDADHEATGYVAKDEKYPVFKMALEYYLDAENGLTVRLPCNGLRYDAATYNLQNLTVLPYMGAANYKNAGVSYEVEGIDGTVTKQTLENYTFFPDGSGALFDHAELGTSTEKLLGYVYGEDYAYHQLIGLKFHKAVRYPAYGVVTGEMFYKYSYQTGQKDDAGQPIYATERISCTVITEDDLIKSLEERNIFLTAEDIEIEAYQRGYAAFVEEADSFTRFQLYHGGALHNYSTVYPYFNPKASDTYNLSGSAADSAESVGIKSDRKYTGSFTLHYVMLTDAKLATEKQTTKYYSTSWLGMAEAYRDYLTRTGRLSNALTAEDVKEDIPLYIESFGALETKETIATIPVWVMTPLTTFENVWTMYSELSGLNVKNINFKLTGFANGGMYSTMPYKLKWEKNVGGANGFKDLITKAEEVNAKTDGSHLGLYPDFDFAYAQGDATFDGLNLKKDAVKTLDNRYTLYRAYDAARQSFTTFYQLAISPSRYSRFYEKLLSNYDKYNLSSMSVATLGNTLNSDFDEDEPYNREQSKNFTTQALSNIQNKGYSLMVDGGNAYTWAYVDHILNVELDSSRYLTSCATVPFVGSVLHGYIQFAGAPLNEEGDVNYAILRAIENGSGLYFILSYQNTTELKEDAYLNQYYSIRYDIWLEDVAKYYNQLNTVLKDVQTKAIINHEFLVGERVLDLDELEADIENRLEDAILEQNKIQSNLSTSDAVAVSNAWNLLYNAELTMKDMRDKVNAINAEIAVRCAATTDANGDRIADILDGAAKNPKTLLNFKSRIEGQVVSGTGVGLIPSFIVMSFNSEAKDTFNIAINQITAQFEELRDVANFLAQSSVDLKEIQERVEGVDGTGGIIAEMTAALNLIKTTDVYNNNEELRALLVADCENRIEKVEQYIDEIVSGCKRHTEAGTGRDYLNSESDLYFMKPIKETINTYFEEGFEESGAYTQVYKKHATDLQKQVADADIPTQLAKLKNELNKACPIATITEEYIFAQIQGSEEDEEEEEQSVATNNNRIVVVTYGDRNADTFAKTAYKSIILNYNSYAVRVVYENPLVDGDEPTLYTIPSGGYIVIEYND